MVLLARATNNGYLNVFFLQENLRDGGGGGGRLFTVATGKRWIREKAEEHNFNEKRGLETTVIGQLVSSTWVISLGKEAKVVSLRTPL